MKENKKPVDVIIAGGGLTGLVTAFYLKRSGLNPVIIEKTDRTGGVIKTMKENGFTFEAGPNTGVLSHPEVAELFEELGGNCKLEIANPRAKKRLIWKSGKWNALPSGPLSAISTPLFTFSDKLRILTEPFRKRGKDPLEPLSGLVKRRLGKSFLDYAVDPFISGIYAGDPDRLITRYALPKLYALEQNYGSFIGGAVKKSFEKTEERVKKATREVFSSEGGLSSLTDALTAPLAGNIIYNAEGTRISFSGDRYSAMVQLNGQQRQIEAPYMVSTVDSGELRELLPFTGKDELIPVTSLEYAAVTQVVLGYNKWDGVDLNAFGGLVPSVENRDILGVLFTSSFLKGRAPEGGALLSVFLGGSRKPHLVDMDDKETEKLVLREVQNMMGTKNLSPELLRIFRYRRAIPQYGDSSPARLRAIESLQERYRGLVIGGNVRDGIGMADRIRQGREIASLIAAGGN